ncbi:MAG: ABC transporter permease [Hyphomicrobiales bacterium]|nr:ABC transporter permease [Hyphomicrobiales bacterium]
MSELNDSALDCHVEESRVHLEPRGRWTVNTLAGLERRISGIEVPSDAQRIDIDLAALKELDTAGAWLLVRSVGSWRAGGLKTVYSNISDKHRVLLEEVAEHPPQELPPPERVSSLVRLLDDTGHAVTGAGEDVVRVLAFLGAAVSALGRAVARPARLRFTSVVHHMEHTGLRAVGIIGLMSFLIGGIIAQQGAFQLRRFGAELFAVDLVGILVLRELGVLMTAIMFAGRSGSAFTAELGSMKMREEIDAMRIIGLDPIETLIVPRLVALILTLPMVTFMADMLGLVGAGMVAKYYIGMSPTAFLERLREGIGMNTFLVGLFKAPFMALVIGLISCVEGLKVTGSAESLGRQTTASVVKSIFMVIVLDALFAMFLSAVSW